MRYRGRLVSPVAANITTSGASSVWQLPEHMQSVYAGTWPTGVKNGATAGQAAASAQAIQTLGIYTDGAYYIDLPTAGPTLCYCLLDTKWDGGGWIMAAKSSAGSTQFQYSSSDWTTVTTINTGSTNLTVADAKFHSMNYFQSKDLLAIFPDMTSNSGCISNLGNWNWLQNNFYGASRTTLISFFGGAANQSVVSPAWNYCGFSSSFWSYEGGANFYGFNYNQAGGWENRWGFAFNNEGNWGSNDAGGGIGFSGSSGRDAYGCCGSAGVNRTFGWYIYVR